MRISIVNYHTTVAINLKGKKIWVEIAGQMINLCAQTTILLTSNGMPVANLNPAFASACRRASNGYITSRNTSIM